MMSSAFEGPCRSLGLIAIGRSIAEARSVREASLALANEAIALAGGRAAVVVLPWGEIENLDWTPVLDACVLEAQSGLAEAPPLGGRLIASNPSAAARELLSRDGCVPILATPVGYPDGRIAILAVGGHRAPPQGLDDDWATCALAELAALAAPLLRHVARHENSESAKERPEAGTLDRTERLRALGELTSGVAHDLNNLLHAVALRARVLSQKLGASPESAALIEDARTIERLTLDGGAAVRRLLDFARRRTSNAREPLDNPAILADVAMLAEPKWRRLAEIGGLAFQISTDVQTHRRAVGDPAELREALLNLAINALDAMPRGGTLTLRVRDAGDCVAFEVEDTGIGMPGEVLRRAGEPFFTTKATGTGLGLAAVRGIAERNGGRVEIDTEAGCGTRVRLVIPTQTPEGARLQERAGEDTKTVQKLPAAGRRLAVLLVEDDGDVRATLTEWFALYGHTVTATGDGDGAMRVVAERRFDVAVLDLGLPGMNGWQVARAIASAQPGLPIVLVTGWGVVLDDQVRTLGVAEVLTKPVPPDHLLATCLEIVRAAANDPAGTPAA